MAFSRSRMISAAIRFIFMAAVAFLICSLPEANANAGLSSTEHRFFPESRDTLVHLTPPLCNELTLVFRENKSFSDPAQVNSFPQWHNGNSGHKTPDTFELIGLVIEEFDLFQGLKEFTDLAEDRMDECIERMHLKGEINFARDSSRQWRVFENFRFDGGVIVQMKETFGKTQWLRQIMPDRIGWNFRSNFSDKYLIGELNIGRYLSVEGSLGNDTACILRIECPF